MLTFRERRSGYSRAGFNGFRDRRDDLRKAALAAGLVAAAIAAACGGGSDDGPSSPSGGGSASASRSHNAGRNCLQCHNEFRVAGTVYAASGAAKSGATVRLTTAPSGGGTVLATLTSDGTGNFYTSQSVSFGSGVYAQVTGSSGTLSKKGAITSGACNSCHGVSTPRLQVD